VKHCKDGCVSQEFDSTGMIGFKTSSNLPSTTIEDISGKCVSGRRFIFSIFYWEKLL
jgi:hypothetical protein